jgi:hypothetical protein
LKYIFHCSSITFYKIQTPPIQIMWANLTDSPLKSNQSDAIFVGRPFLSIGAATAAARQHDARLFNRAENSSNDEQKVYQCHHGSCAFSYIVKKGDDGHWIVDKFTQHTSTCVSPRTVSAQVCAENPQIQALVYTKKLSAIIIKKAVMEVFDCEISDDLVHDIKVVIVDKAVEKARENNSKLIPFLQEFSRLNPEAGAEIQMKARDVHQEIKIGFGILEGEGDVAKTAQWQSSNVGAWKLEYCIVVYPWANKVLPGGPSVFSSDTCSTSSSRMKIMSFGMRCIGTYVPLVTLFCSNEDEFHCRLLFKRVYDCLELQETGNTVYTDRGKAVLAALRYFIGLSDNPDFAQRKTDFPHLWRNVLATFPKLKEMEDEEGLRLIKNYMYSLSDSERVPRKKELDQAFERVQKKTAATTTSSTTTSSSAKAREAPVVVDSDGDVPGDEQGRVGAPAYLIPLLDQAEIVEKKIDTPSAYIDAVHNQFSVFLDKDKFSSGGITSNNSTETVHSFWQRAGVRDKSTIPDMITGVIDCTTRLLVQKVEVLRQTKEKGEAVLPCWPFHEREDNRSQDGYTVERVDEYTFNVTTVKTGRTSRVCLFCNVTDPPTENIAADKLDGLAWGKDWMNPDRGISCGGCKFPQIFRIPCPHVLRAMAAYFASDTFKSKYPDSAARRQAEKDLVLSSYASYYRIDELEKVFKFENRRVRFPMLRDIAAGRPLEPIAPLKIKVDRDPSNGGRPSVTDTRSTTRTKTPGEAEEAEIKGKKRASSSSSAAKSQAPKRKYRCKSCGRVGHNKRSCPTSSGAPNLGDDDVIEGDPITSDDDDNMEVETTTAAATDVTTTSTTTTTTTTTTSAISSTVDPNVSLPTQQQDQIMDEGMIGDEETFDAV